MYTFKLCQNERKWGNKFFWQNRINNISTKQSHIISHSYNVSTSKITSYKILYDLLQKKYDTTRDAILTALESQHESA